MKYDKEEIAEVRRQLGEHPIFDAKSSLKFIVKKEDVERAIPKNPHSCVFARAIARISGINKGIVIFPRFSYVPWDLHGDGKFIIQRYSNVGKMRRAIQQYDVTGAFDQLGEYSLLPPSKSITLNERKRSRKRRKKQQAADKIIVAKNKADKKSVPAKKRNIQPPMSFLDYRRGTGKARMVAKSLVTHDNLSTETLEMVRDISGNIMPSARP